LRLDRNLFEREDSDGGLGFNYSFDEREIAEIKAQFTAESVCWR